MDHTYLRYECADSFGLAVSSASSKAPPSNANLAFLPVNNNNSKTSRSPPLLLTTAGSYCLGFNLKSGLPQLKLGHREQLSGGVGTGRALNSDEMVCLDVSSNSSSNSSLSTIKVATGWVDGAVRIFDLYFSETNKPMGMAHSLLDDKSNSSEEEFARREPLVLNGHSQSPIRTVAFDKGNVSRLASGGSDGTIILWDIVAETGLFRLIGHRGGITDIMFLHLSSNTNNTNTFDGMITSSLDGLVKIWDLDGQCCTQTIANNHGEVWGAACMQLTVRQDEKEETPRWRLIAGGNDGQSRVWSVQSPKRLIISGKNNNDDDDEEKLDDSLAFQGDKDDLCFFMGRLLPPPNVATSSEKVICVHYHPSGQFLGILHANSKHVDVYIVRSTKESMKKRQRRLRRRQEKQKKKDSTSKKDPSGSKKRGLLDDDEPSDDETNNLDPEDALDPELLKASDEFEYLVTVRASHKVCGFHFVPMKEKGEITRIICALSTNSLETFSIQRKKQESNKATIITFEKQTTMDMYGHPTGIRAIGLSSDDHLACTVSKNTTKIWNIASRTCIQSLSPSVSSGKKTSSCYGLCATFLPGNTHVAVGTREGHLLLIDIPAGEVVYCEEGAHGSAIWSIDVRRPTPTDESVSIVTGSADKSVKFWDLEAQDEDNESRTPMFVHTRTLQMSDDVIAVRFSNATERSKLLVFVSTLDCTVKVFFEDSLKLFLSLYGHKLPALAIDASDDDMILASSGADKTVKIFGLDFGDTHRTLHGHEDSVTDLRFIKRTHNFFTASKDGSLRYWDGDRFEQILVLNGHNAEVNCLAVSRTGAFVLSGGMDRQVRVWERTRDIVFLEEERERELEQVFDRVNTRDEADTADILDRKKREGDGEDDEASIDEGLPQSEAAIKKSVLSVSSGDRIMEALERADQETKDIVLYKKSHGPDAFRQPNPLLLNLQPAHYVLWVLKSIKSAELEQSLLVLPLTHLERLIHYMILLLKDGRGVEICSRVAIFLVKTHQSQVRVFPII